MKIDDKKEEVQRKYREKIRQGKQGKEDKSYRKEAFIVSIIFMLIFLLNFYFKAF
ncbi:hypothetical protein EDD69_11315 [Thermolongibacillus altinsuensis]|jgi:hypothetical protein|uniref:Uncharacterized protein n=1 Tax=Thermolongibacillus altinsuensis TaxID=575256 RepID=A0A4R1QFF1_9BACL|nr:hypothetical protein [Thermolongibacillus altinsuensis]TCL47009.1 hypothetical protein EDD69_11315 [Thermolongibacillus altinsuensis]